MKLKNLFSILLVFSSLTFSISEDNQIEKESNVKMIDLFNLPNNQETKSLVSSLKCSTCHDDLTKDGEKYGRSLCCIYASFSKCIVLNKCHLLDKINVENSINYTANLYGCKDGPTRFISFHCLIQYYWISVVIAGVLFLIFAAMLCIQMAMRKSTW